jgi:DNA-directed RNA polymerase specialized sigma24 family protein
MAKGQCIFSPDASPKDTVLMNKRRMPRSNFFAAPKRNPAPTHDVSGPRSKVMIPKQKFKAQLLRSGYSVSSGDEASFQLTLLRAFMLPPACRDVFVLKEIQGYSLPEVAATLGISKDDVTKHLRRARREMQTS